MNYPESIALSGNDLFVSNEFGGTIGEYNATTGAAINASLITGVGEPEGIAVSGSNLFVVNGYVDTVGEYSLTNTGASGLDTDNLVIAAPVVTPSGTTNAFDLGGSAVAVDSGVTVTSYDTDLTGADGHDRLRLPVGRHAPFHQPEWHQRQLLRGRAHPERLRHAGPVPDGFAVRHLLHHQHGHHHPVAVDRRTGLQ